MEIDAIRNIVQKELAKITNNKEEITKRLVEPSKEHFSIIDGGERELWIIGKKDEFYLVFDANKRLFGLAFRNVMNENVCLGDEGSLADAYEALISREEPSGKESPRSASPFYKKRKRH